MEFRETSLHYDRQDFVTPTQLRRAEVLSDWKPECWERASLGWIDSSTTLLRQGPLLTWNPPWFPEFVYMATVPTAAELQYERTHYDDSQVRSLLASNILFLGLAIMAVATRFLCRWVSKIRYDYDEWFIVAGLVSISFDLL